MSVLLELLVRLDGRRIINAAGDVLAELGDDEQWRTPDGTPVDGLTIPRAAAAARVDSAAQREHDDAWLAETVLLLRGLLSQRATITSDNVWAIAAHPPREARMIGNAMSRAKAEGLMVPTDDTIPSTKKINHGRPIRVWRSLIYDGA